MRVSSRLCNDSVCVMVKIMELSLTNKWLCFLPFSLLFHILSCFSLNSNLLLLSILHILSLFLCSSCLFFSFAFFLFCFLIFPCRVISSPRCLFLFWLYISLLNSLGTLFISVPSLSILPLSFLFLFLPPPSSCLFFFVPMVHRLVSTCCYTVCVWKQQLNKQAHSHTDNKVTQFGPAVIVECLTDVRMHVI